MLLTLVELAHSASIVFNRIVFGVLENPEDNMTRSRSSRGDASSSGRSRDPKLLKPRYFTRSRSRRTAMLGGHQEGQGRVNHVTDETHWDRMQVLKSSKKAPGESLNVTNVEFNKELNGLEHRTENYELEELVIRRGQPWTLTLEFDRQIDLNADDITLQFAFGNQPKESKGTLLRVKPNLDGKGARKWTASVDRVEGHQIHFKVSSPANALIGRYGVFVETALKNKSESISRHEVENEDFILLFNPWNEQDVVYMANEEERQEYVLTDHGRIWVGSASSHHGRPWYFGQFENPVLEAALSLLDDAEIGDTARANPVTFVRAMSALCNSMDDKGVLEGRWTEAYPKDCILPWVWTGSVKIIKAFMDNRKSVKFGQCWVFSGLMTSLLRSVGIPTRSVTNFESAHDTDSSMTIDSHFDESGEPVTWMDDSVWNFHVWNESFFKRLDLPDGYDGWQAHDATPQELSEGVMRCGPAPLKAIKEGHVYLNYDVPFIFSEVNGDKVNWMVLEDGTMVAIDIDGRSVGRNISTKSVGSNLRQDVTHQYKYPEGSDDERRVVEFVNRFSSRSGHDIYDSDTVKDVEFSMEFSPTSIGEVLKTTAMVKSKSKEPRSIQGCITVLSSFYTGVPGKRIKSQRFEMELSASGENEFVLEMTPDDYMSKLHPEASVQAYASFSVKQTRQQFARTLAYIMLKPSLDLKIPGDVKAKQQTTGAVEFTNKLPIPLTGGSITLEGSSIMSMDVITINHPIQPSQTVSFPFDICPRRQGNQEIDATFTSDQLSGVDGSIEFHVSRS